MPPRDPRIRLGWDNAMGQRFSGKTCLLAQRVGRDRKINNCPDIFPNCCRGWDPRRKLLLLSRLPQQEGAQKYLPHACPPTRMPVPLIPKSDNRGREEEPLRCSLQPSSPWSVATPTSYLRSNSSSLEGRNLGFGPARGFPLPLLELLTEILLLHGVELSRVDEDIRLYPRGKLNATAKLRSGLGLSNPWPCNEDLNILTKKS